MDPVDLVPSGYRFVPTAEELVVDYLANWIAGTPPGRAVAFADVYGTEPWNLLGSDRRQEVIFAERQPKASGCSRVDRTAGTGSWLLNRRQEPVKSIVDGREIVVGRRSYLSFKDGRRKNSGWVMYEYEMCSSTFETRVLCHVKKSSYQPISGGKFMKSVESTFTEAATETLTGGSSFVGQREIENLLLSSAAPKKPCRGWLHIQRSIPVRPLTTSDRGGATALIGSRRDNPGRVIFPPSTPWHRTKPSPSRHPIVNGRWWR
ncbi:unnamed protein product [Musa acuminata subsp. burmannicoides]